MRDANPIVGKIARVEPALDKPPVEVLAGSDEGLTFEFADGRRARLDRTDERAVPLAGLLEDFRRRGRPLYVEVDPVTERIARVRLPIVGRVAAVRSTGDGDLEIDIPPSHARHVLRRDHPNFDASAELLRSAIAGRRPVLLTENDNHELLDLRWYPDPEEVPPFPKPGLPPKWWRRWPWERWPWRWYLDLWELIQKLLSWWLSAVPQTVADDMFALANGLSCQPQNPSAPCITFLFPDDGCYARAHEMCRLMGIQGVPCRKVFNYGSLYVQTKNHPNCHVSWGYHVAPTVRVRQAFLTVQEQVIDPALFGGPVPTATWRAIQTDLNSSLVGTDASVYYRSPNGTTVMYDASYVDTNQTLQDFRDALALRSIQDGPPPYAACP